MKKGRRVLNKIFIFIFSVVCVAVCVCLAEVFSSFLTVGGIPVVSTSNSQLSDFKVYAISLGSYSSKYLAETNASGYRQKNAGGYVLKIDEVYHIIASAYEKENDAKLVQSNLLEESITSSIVNISFDEVQLENVSSSSIGKEFINSLSIFRTVFLELYDISVSLDTSVIDITKARIEIISIKAEIEEHLAGIGRGTTAVDGIYYQMIKNKLDLSINILNDLKNYEEEGGIILSSKIKYTYLYILDLANDLISSLNNEF